MFYVYILKLYNEQVYVGRTSDLKRRVAEHQKGEVRSTNKREPKLVFYEAFQSKDDSIRRERYLKTSKGKSTLRMMLINSLK